MKFRLATLNVFGSNLRRFALDGDNWLHNRCFHGENESTRTQDTQTENNG